MKNQTKVYVSKYRLKKWVINVLSALSAILITSIIATNIISDVLLNRGYFAFGGEWFFFIAVLYSTYLIILTLLEFYNE